MTELIISMTLKIAAELTIKLLVVASITMKEKTIAIQIPYITLIKNIISVGMNTHIQSVWIKFCIPFGALSFVFATKSSNNSQIGSLADLGKFFDSTVAFI